MLIKYKLKIFKKYKGIWTAHSFFTPPLSLTVILTFFTYGRSANFTCSHFPYGNRLHRPLPFPCMCLFSATSFL